MSQGPFQRTVSSKPTVHFIEGLAANGGTSAVYDIGIGWSGGRTGFNIRNVLCESMQAFDMKLHLFATNAGALVATPGSSTWLGYIALYANQFLTIAGATPVFNQWADVFQRYVDLDAINAFGDTPWAIHAVLVNADAAVAKLAGAPGAIKFDFVIEGTGE